MCVAFRESRLRVPQMTERTGERNPLFICDVFRTDSRFDPRVADRLNAVCVFGRFSQNRSQLFPSLQKAELGQGVEHLAFLRCQCGRNRFAIQSDDRGGDLRSRPETGGFHIQPDFHVVIQLEPDSRLPPCGIALSRDKPLRNLGLHEDRETAWCQRVKCQIDQDTRTDGIREIRNAGIEWRTQPLVPIDAQGI